ncbi:hypothetical protein ACERK3_01420 [Phycisphaerales bacterium AB-hyl4]|uniref:Replication initiation protein n=1 Tax=Natronomicrosphaera hydrolytica TaxID=3242702 RepID=A0ABV4U016_9BACT
MSNSDPTERFKDIPALMNPTTPALRRLRARLEGRAIVIPRELKRKKGRSAAKTAEERRKNSEAHARRRAAQRVQVPLKLVDPHPLIEETRRAFEGATPEKDGIMRPAKVRRLDIEASEAQLDRALLIFDTLIKALEQRGLTIEIAKRKPRCTRITVAGRQLTFSLTELPDKKPHKLTAEEKRREKEDRWRFSRDEPPQWDYFPSGKLRLRLEGVPEVRGCWSDGMRYLVEDCLHHFLKAVDAAPHRLTLDQLMDTLDDQDDALRARRREFVEMRNNRLKWLRELRAKRKKRKRKAELARLRQLEKEFTRWQQAEALRAYASYREMAATSEGAPLPPRSELGKWLRWVRRYADRLDPSKPEAGEPLELPKEPAPSAPPADHYREAVMHQRPYWFYRR